jgi:hypothetical protein
VIEPGYLRDAIAALYSSDPDQFTERRGVLVAHAREAGDAAVAKAVAALRKPTRSAWVVNQLVRSDPGAIPRLAALGDELRAAERFMNGTKLRELSAQRRQLIDSLLRQALAVSGQQSPPAAMRDEVVATLTAAMSDPQVAVQLRAGTLLRAVSRAGFGSLAPADLTFAPDLAALPRDTTAATKPAPAKQTGGTTRPARSGARTAGTARSARAADGPAQRRPAGPPTVQERAERARAAREQAAQERAETARVKRAQAAQERAERERRRAAIATAEKAATAADRTARTAVRTLAELDGTVEQLAEELADARQRQAEARVASRQALNAQRKAHRDLDRLTGAS